MYSTVCIIFNIWFSLLVLFSKCSSYCHTYRWIKSSAKKDGVDEDISKYDGEWALEAPREGGFEEDRGLVVKVSL